MFERNVLQNKNSSVLFIRCVTSQVGRRTVERYQNEVREQSRKSWCLSWVLNTNEEEEQQNISFKI